MLSADGRGGHRGGRRVAARRARAPAHRPADRLPAAPRTLARSTTRGSTPRRPRASSTSSPQLYAAFVDLDAMLLEINPLILTADGRGARARRQGDDRRQRAVPPPGRGGPARVGHRRPAGADGAGEGRHLRQAGRRRRHPRQRRRPGDEHARRGRAGGRPAGQLPGRRRRLAGRRGGHRAGGPPVATPRSSRCWSTSSAASPAATRSPRACSRRWTGSARPLPIVVRLDGTNEEEGRAIIAERAPANVVVGADDALRRRDEPSSSRRRPHEHPRQRGHPARGAGHHRARGRRSTPRATRPTAPRSSPASPRARPARTSRASRSSTPSATRSRRPAPTPPWSSCRRASRPTRSTRPSRAGVET